MAANYFDTALLGYTGRVAERFNKPELRELESKVLTVGLENSQYLMDVAQIDQIKETSNRPVYADQFTRKAAVNGSSFTAFHTGAQGTSQRTALTWVGFTEPFSIFATTGQDNDLRWQAIFDNEVAQTQRILRERLRVWLMGQLHSARTAGGNATTVSGGVWNGATNAYEINDQAQFFSKVKQIMRQNKYYDNYDIFCDSSLFPQYEFTVAQGVNNAQNLAYQMKGFTNVFPDNILGNQVAEEYNNGMALVMPENAFALVPFLPALFTNPRSDRDASHFGTYGGGYGVIPDGWGVDYKTFGGTSEKLMYGIHGWSTQADNSASNGSTVDVTMQFQIGLYMCFQTAVLSNANETPIFEFGYTG
jgi:hypothetical protein